MLTATFYNQFSVPNIDFLAGWDVFKKTEKKMLKKMETGEIISIGQGLFNWITVRRSRQNK